MAQQSEYKVDLEVFEGPLDLLLYLIKKDEVDIYNIPIERITSQYMEYLNLMRMLDLNIAGEFIVMAATLMMIKSRMLLPEDERPELEEEEADPRWDLVRQLLEYKKFKDAAAKLQEREWHQENVFGIGGQTVTGTEEPGLVLQDVSLFDLISAFNEVLKKAKAEQIGEIIADRFTVADKIAEVLRVVTLRGQVLFTDLFTEGAPRPEVICTFLALLELIRLRHVNARQDHAFGAIVICRVTEEEIAQETAAAAAREAEAAAEAAPAPAEGASGEAEAPSAESEEPEDEPAEGAPAEGVSGATEAPSAESAEPEDEAADTPPAPVPEAGGQAGGA